MQKRHSYPARRSPSPPIFWRARPDADINAQPLPVSPALQERARAIRRVFLTQFGGAATILEVGDACDDLGLLNGFGSHQAAYETIKRTLRPLCHPNGPGYAYTDTGRR